MVTKHWRTGNSLEHLYQTLHLTFREPPEVSTTIVPRLCTKARLGTSQRVKRYFNFLKETQYYLLTTGRLQAE